MGIIQRIKSSLYNLFSDSKNNEQSQILEAGYSSTFAMHRSKVRSTVEKSIINALYNRVSMDVAAMKFRHARLDDSGAYVETIDSSLNECLYLEPNKDQNSSAFIQDVVMSMFDEGCVAIVPVDTTASISDNDSFGILTMRTGKVIEWFPNHVKVNVYNDRSGKKEDIFIEKSKICLIENPFYSIMNEKNSTLYRLMEKLNLLDYIDKQSGSGKLNMIVQLPFSVRSESRKEQAESRLRSIEDQLTKSPFGIAYADATEKIIQLNRPFENNLLAQIEFLTKLLFSQIGISESILNNTASETELLNYHNRVIVPISNVIVLEMTRKFLTKTARSQKQGIKYLRNYLDMITPERLGDLADKLTRNEVTSSNEIRSVIGLIPSKDPNANKLRNKNIGINKSLNSNDNLEGEFQNESKP